MRVCGGGGGGGKGRGGPDQSRAYLLVLLVVEIALRHLPLRSVLVFFVYTGAGVANMLYNNLTGT